MYAIRSYYGIRNWSIKGVDLNNATQSLLWTGFSVPILGGVKIGFDAFWPLAHEGLVFEWTKFLLICLANGLYISTVITSYSIHYTKLYD